MYLPLDYVTAASRGLKWPFRAQQQGERKKLHVSACTTALLTTACVARRTRRSQLWALWRFVAGGDKLGNEEIGNVEIGK